MQGIIEEQKLDKKNTAIKFALDQTVGATVNNILFLGLISALRGRSLVGCVQKIAEVGLAYGIYDESQDREPCSLRPNILRLLYYIADIHL